MRTKGLRQEMEQRLIAYNDRRCARQLAKLFDITGETVRLVIRKDVKIRFYRITTRPKLSNDNKKQRASFAYWVQNCSKKIIIY